MGVAGQEAVIYPWDTSATTGTSEEVSRDQSKKAGLEKHDEVENVNVSSLAALTGFPEDFIRKELLLDAEQGEMSLESLREKMLTYLDKTMME